MTIHFSAARNSQADRIARTLIASVPFHPANDNGPEPANDALLRATLRHFGEHGLGAARLAADWAVEALAAGDMSEARHWLEICRSLDRRLAMRTERWLGMQASD